MSEYALRRADQCRYHIEPLRIKRVYNRRGTGDGVRVLVDPMGRGGLIAPLLKPRHNATMVFGLREDIGKTASIPGQGGPSCAPVTVCAALDRCLTCWSDSSGQGVGAPLTWEGQR
jgi:hypothetical protein